MIFWKKNSSKKIEIAKKKINFNFNFKFNLFFDFENWNFDTFFSKNHISAIIKNGFLLAPQPWNFMGNPIYTVLDFNYLEKFLISPQGWFFVNLIIVQSDIEYFDKMSQGIDIIGPGCFMTNQVTNGDITSISHNFFVKTNLMSKSWQWKCNHLFKM
jgi:hypothetical protein